MTAIEDLASYFAELMSLTWAVEGTDSVQLNDGSHVQWGKYPIGLVVEVSSGRNCRPRRARTTKEVEQLLALGFARPVDYDEPNFWQLCLDVSVIPAASRALAAAVLSVLSTDVVSLGPAA